MVRLNGQGGYELELVISQACVCVLYVPVNALACKGGHQSYPHHLLKGVGWREGSEHRVLPSLEVVVEVGGQSHQSQPSLTYDVDVGQYVETNQEVFQYGGCCLLPVVFHLWVALIHFPSLSPPTSMMASWSMGEEVGDESVCLQLVKQH